MSECTVQLWYNKQRPKKDGTVSLYIQLIVDGEHDQIPLKNLNWPIDKIDWEKKQLSPRFNNDTDLISFNAIIEAERNKYWSVIMGFLRRNVSFSLKDIYKEVNLYSSGQFFYAYMEYAIKLRLTSENQKERIKGSTGRTHRVTLVWVKKYLKNKDVDIQLIDSRWMESFADYLRKYMCENTVWVKIKDVKTYINFAANNKIQVNLDYKRFSITPEDTNPTWLEESDVNALLELYWKKDVSKIHHRNLRAFLFACFTGLRISDLSRWSKDWIEGNEIVFIPVKRRFSKRPPKPIKIPILPIAWDFINDLSQNETFGIPDHHVYNRELKALSALAGIQKQLTSHVARHTFATWLALSGVPVLVISKLLGHKTTTPTMVYIHIAETYKAVEMMKLQTRFGKKTPDNPPPELPAKG